MCINVALNPNFEKNAQLSNTVKVGAVENSRLSRDVRYSLIKAEAMHAKAVNGPIEKFCAFEEWNRFVHR